MGTVSDSESAAIASLLAQARAGQPAALNELFSRHRERLRRMVEIRLDRRLHGRIDASDVIQDAYVEVVERLAEYFRNPKLPFFLWLRLVVGERLMKLHRQHLGTQMRDAGRQVSLYREALPAASSAALAAHLLGRQTSPTQAAVRAERMLRLQEALNTLEPIDREILSLRHFEELNRAESAQVLGIEEAAAAKRYIRALKRLKDILADMPGGLEGL
ncbi:MAG TPA: sigma-70 family RNA polymerase sigma factor [Gemmataceae bacterium]|jgi:RNA polymerase sigma-70 factor (ECF subfamily)|nr:sigma-70 family RNA polymerase sigma factor [Gemmataceae bacterium]